MNGCVTILTTTNYYYLSEKYKFDEIVNKVKKSSYYIDDWITLRDSKENLVCIKSSSIEAIKMTYARPL